MVPEITLSTQHIRQGMSRRALVGEVCTWWPLECVKKGNILPSPVAPSLKSLPSEHFFLPVSYFPLSYAHHHNNTGTTSTRQRRHLSPWLICDWLPRRGRTSRPPSGPSPLNTTMCSILLFPVAPQTTPAHAPSHPIHFSIG